MCVCFKCVTLPATNIDSENQWLEDGFPFGMDYFQGICLVSGSVKHLQHIVVSFHCFFLSTV